MQLLLSQSELTSSVGSDPAPARICDAREFRRSGMVRAAKEFPSHPPEPARAGGAALKSTFSAEAVRERRLQRVLPSDPKRRTLARISSPRGAAPTNPAMKKEIKIIQFVVNIDKFTGFFDKFLKMNDRRMEDIISCNSDGYDANLKRKRNILPHFTE